MNYRIEINNLNSTRVLSIIKLVDEKGENIGNGKMQEHLLAMSA